MAQTVPDSLFFAFYTDTFTFGKPIEIEHERKLPKDVMQEHFDPKKLPPIRKWETERDKLKAERQQLSHRYSALKDEVKEVEQIRRNVHSILREENGREQPTRKQGLDR